MVTFQLYQGAMIFVDIAINLFGLCFVATLIGYGGGKLAVRLVNRVLG